MPKVMTIRCTACGQTISAQINNIVDVSKEPQLKPMLLAGQLNVVPCNACGTPNNVLTPLMYHDASKELLVAYVPMELNMNKDQQERAIGDMMNELPKTNFKGYMFNPKRALTMQGLVDLILQADGVTPEMMAEQRARVDLMQKMIEAPSDDVLDALIKENDAKIDVRFYQTMTAMIQRMVQGGREELAERALYVQNRMTELTTYGQELIKKQVEQEKIVQIVSEELQALGQMATRTDLLNYVLKYRDNEDYLQAIVGLVRPALDYEFFEEVNAYIGSAPADERPALENMRDLLVNLTRLVDQQAQARVQVAVQLLQAMMNAGEELDALILGNLPLIDDTFMSVIVANIEEMQRRGNIQVSTRLKEIYQHVVAVLQARMSPELGFVNRLLSAESDAEVNELIGEAKNYGDSLLEVMDSVDEMLNAQGQSDIAQRLKSLRQEVAAALEK